MVTLDSRPYAWPWHGAFEPARTALVVSVDAPPAASAEPAMVRVRALTSRARAAGVTVVSLPSACHPAASVVPGADLVIPRPRHSAMVLTTLDLELRRRGLTDLLVAGFPFETGADCTMRQANDLGYECLLLEDCCTGLSEETLAGAIRSCTMSGGIFGAVATAGAVLAALDSLITPPGA